MGCDTAWCGSQGRAAEPEAKQVMGDILDQRFISAGECFNVSTFTIIHQSEKIQGVPLNIQFVFCNLFRNVKVGDVLKIGCAEIIKTKV